MGGDGHLAGLRVLDLALWQPGQTATQLLADLGADVIKVEPPGGDRMRTQPDRFVNFNGHKRSVVADLKTDAGHETLAQLVREADVLVEGFRPGVAARLGVAYEQVRPLNPRLVYCSITGFGQDGDLALHPGHEFNYLAWAGALDAPPGTQPSPPGLLVGDQGSGLAAAFAVLAAVIGARRTGEGEHIDLSMTDLLATWVAPFGYVDPARAATVAAIDAPATGMFATRDGRTVSLGVFTEDHYWDGLCRALGLDERVGLDTAARTQRAAELRAELTAAIAGFTLDELIAKLDDEPIPLAPALRRTEMLDHPHFRARGTIAVGPDGGRVVTHPVRYRNRPALPPGLPPALGAHQGARFEPDEPG